MTRKGGYVWRSGDFSLSTEGTLWWQETLRDSTEFGGDKAAMWHTQAVRARDYIKYLEARLEDAEDTLIEAWDRLDEAELSDQMANIHGYWARYEDEE